MQLSYTIEPFTHDVMLQKQAETCRESSSGGPCVVSVQRSTCAHVAAVPVPAAVSGRSDAQATMAVRCASAEVRCASAAAAEPLRWPGPSSERHHRDAKSQFPTTATVMTTASRRCGGGADVSSAPWCSLKPRPPPAVNANHHWPPIAGRPIHRPRRTTRLIVATA